jgi:hypothetical protein
MSHEQWPNLPPSERNWLGCLVPLLVAAAILAGWIIDRFLG